MRFPIANWRLETSAGGSIGSAVRCSHHTNRAISRVPLARQATISALAQPTWLARVSAQTSATTPAVTSPTPARSRRSGAPWLSGRSRVPSSTAARPSGTLSQKIQCQSIVCVITPPTIGPSATARPASPPYTPTIIPRFSGGNAVVRIVRLSGSTTAAPSPCTVRATISSEAPGTSAQAADASVNSGKPVLNTRRRPKRSPSAAAVMIPAANAIPYAFTVHCSEERPTCRSRCIRGSAVITTSASRTTIK